MADPVARLEVKREGGTEEAGKSEGGTAAASMVSEKAEVERAAAATVVEERAVGSVAEASVEGW